MRKVSLQGSDSQAWKPGLPSLGFGTISHTAVLFGWGEASCSEKTHGAVCLPGGKQLSLE